MERLKSLLENKKGQLGLNTVKAVMIAFLILAIVAVALILTVVNMRNVAEDIDTKTLVLANIVTSSVVNDTGAYPIGLSGGNRNCGLTITEATNNTDAEDINSGNYTISGCLIIFIDAEETEAPFNNSLWNITGEAVYSDSRTYDIGRNVTVGVREFFTNTSTIFAILIVVVIILAISIIIAVVSRFGGGAGAGIGGEISGSKREFGSDTVMGV